VKMRTKRINWFVYYFSMLTWIANICFPLLQFFFDISELWFELWFIGVFFSVLIQGIVSGAFYDETLVPEMPVKFKLIDYCLIASKYISFSLFLIGFLSLAIGGGQPEIIDGAYCLVDHGEIVRYISEGWYLYFAVCLVSMFICGILYFSTYMALRIRTLYIIQKITMNE